MIKHVYATGDSCVFGQGLDESVRVFDYSDKVRANCWAGQITTKLGLNVSKDFTNDAQPGASNDHIVRTCMTSVMRLLETHKPEELLVLIGWTDSARTEWYFKNYKDYLRYIPNGLRAKNEPRELHLFYDLWTTSFLSTAESFPRFVRQLIQLQSFLKSVGVPYVMTQSIAVFIGGISNDLRIAYEDVDPIASKYVDWSAIYHRSHILEHVADNKFELTPCHHPKVDGHTTWADIIFKFAQDKYGLVK